MCAAGPRPVLRRQPSQSKPAGVGSTWVRCCFLTRPPVPAFVLCVTWQQAYGLKRLARGLASSRQGARQGFAAALAATLAHSAAAASKGAATAQKLQQPFVSAAGVLAVMDACLEVTGSMKGTVRLMSTVLCAGGCAGCSCGWAGNGLRSQHGQVPLLLAGMQGTYKHQRAAHKPTPWFCRGARVTVCSGCL